MKSSNPLWRFAASARATWLIGIVSLLVVAFEVIGPRKPVPPSAHLTLNVPTMVSLDESSMPAVARRRPKRSASAAEAVGATGIRG
ncbi:MAG: hypothetical protein ACLQU2_24925 [Candidatus Binataceae bacterium]